MSAPVLDPLLAQAERGDLVGLESRCPRADCGAVWAASAEVVNGYGVEKLIPGRCPRHGTLGSVVTIDALYQASGKIIYRDGYTPTLAALDDPETNA